jgi:hypothetical protein
VHVARPNPRYKQPAFARLLRQTAVNTLVIEGLGWVTSGSTRRHDPGGKIGARRPILRPEGDEAGAPAQRRNSFLMIRVRWR